MPLSQEGSRTRVDINHNQVTKKERIPVKPLITLCGTLAGQQLTILKDDGCNTNVLSKTFVNKNRHLLNIQKEQSVISHSDKDYIETSSDIVVDAEVEIGCYKYRSNWVVANSRYDMLLGMPWHEEANPDTDYSSKTVWVGNVTLTARTDKDDRIKVGDLGVKKFKSLLRKKRKSSDDFEVFQICNLSRSPTSFSRDPNARKTRIYQHC